MSLISDLYVKLGFKADEFNKGIDSAKQKTSAFGSAMGKIGGMIAGAFAVGAIINFGKSSMEEFNKAEQGAMRLLTALGGNSRALDMLSNQAKQLQKTTLFEDDETIAAQAAMAMLVKEADKIKILTPLVQDLATAKGIDLTSAGFMVAKSVEGSAMALQKMGIQVEGTAGSAERFTSVVKELNKAVGGQAVNAANVGTGALTQLANAFGNLKEAIGGGMANTGAFKTWTKNLTNGIEDLTVIMESKYMSRWQKIWAIFTDPKGTAAKQNVMKETADKWNAELHPEQKTTAAKPKPQTDAEQLANRLKSLKINIADTTKEMHLLDASTPEWKAASDELKGFKDELNDLTGGTKAQEEADKRSEAAKAALVDQLILQRIEEQKILSLQGKKITTTDKGILLTELSPKGEGLLKVPETKLAGLQVGNNTVSAGIAEGKAQQLLETQEGNTKIEEEEKRFNDSLNQLIQSGMSAAAVTFGVGIGNLMTGDMNIGDFGASLLAAVAGFMVQFGEQMIALAIANGVLAVTMANPLSWPLMLAAGIAVVAAGTALSNISKKGMSGGGSSSGGGGATGYSPQGNQSNAAQALSGNVEFVLRGDTLVGAINNSGKRNYNMK